MTRKVILQSELLCPKCGHKMVDTMPTNACQWFYECEHCRMLISPKQGDCCVFCSFGSVPCPTEQQKAIQQKDNNKINTFR